MVRFWQKFRKELLILLGLGVLPFLIYWDVTIGGQTMLPADNLFQWQPWASYAEAYGVTQPQNHLISDLILQNYAWKGFIREAVAQRDIPLWNPYLFAGIPFLSAGQHGAYYPFSIFFLLLPLTKAYGWYSVSQLWLAAVFTYFWGRVLGWRRSSGVLAGIIYQGCGFMLVSSAVFPMILGAAIWLPALLACIELLVRHHRGKNGLPIALLGGIGLGCQLLAGHIEISYYSLLVMGIYALWRTFQANWGRKQLTALLKSWGWIAGMVTLGILLGAIQFIPFVEVGQTNFREGSASFAEVREYGFPPRRLLTLVVPNFFGNPAHHSYTDAFSGEVVQFTTNSFGEPNPKGAGTADWGIKNYVEGGIYLGVISLFLAGFGVYSARFFAERRGHILFFAGLSLLSLAFIFGTPLYGILYYGLPGINQLHSPFRWVFPLSLAVATLAGYGADYLSLSRGRELPASSKPNLILRVVSLWSKPSMITVSAGISFWGGIFLLAGLYLSRVGYGGVEPTINRLFQGLALAPYTFADGRAFYSYELRQLFLLGLMLVATGATLRVSRCPIFVRGKPIWLLMVAVLLAIDLWMATGDFHSAVSPTLLDVRPALVDWLADQPDYWRITSFDPHGSKPLNANIGWHYDLYDIRGYESVIPKQYTAYMAAIEPQNGLQFNRVQAIKRWESLNSPLLDLLGVRYIITPEEVDLPKLQLAWQGDGLQVYENLGVVARAFTLPASTTYVTDSPLALMQAVDPRTAVIITPYVANGLGDWIPSDPTPAERGNAGIEYYSNREVMVQADISEPSWVLLTDSYADGWKVFIRPAGTEESEEQELPVHLVNGNFRGVFVEQTGAWQLRFRYSPPSFILGGLSSFMGGMICLFALLVWGWGRLVPRSMQLTNTRSIVKNSFAPMVLNIFNRLIDFVFAAFYLRLLGPGDAGSYATAITIASLYEIIANWGLNTLLVREVSADKTQTNRYLLNSTILRLGTGLVAVLPVLIYLFSRGIAGNPLAIETQLALLLLMVGMIFSGWASGVTGLFYAYEQAEMPATIATMTTILKVGFGAVVLLLGWGFVGLAGVSILVNFITLLILLAWAKRQIGLAGGWQLDWGLQKRMISDSYPLMLNHLLATIFFFLDVPILQQTQGDTVVGWYDSAYKYVRAFNIVPSFFTIALFPVITRQINSSIELGRRTFRISVKLLLMLALPLAVMTTALAPLMIGALGGDGFLPAGAIALQLMVWSIPFGWVNSLTNYVLIALGQERMQTRAFAIGVGFNLLANLIFVPLYSYQAAAIITILSEIVLLGVFLYYLAPKMPQVGWLGLLWRPILLTVLMGVAVWLANQWGGWWLGTIAGIVVYGMGIWLLGILGQEERKILVGLLPASIVTKFNLRNED